MGPVTLLGRKAWPGGRGPTRGRSEGAPERRAARAAPGAPRAAGFGGRARLEPGPDRRRIHPGERWALAGGHEDRPEPGGARPPGPRPRDAVGHRARAGPTGTTAARRRRRSTSSQHAARPGATAMAGPMPAPQAPRRGGPPRPSLPRPLDPAAHRAPRGRARRVARAAIARWSSIPRPGPSASAAPPSATSAEPTSTAPSPRSPASPSASGRSSRRARDANFSIGGRLPGGRSDRGRRRGAPVRGGGRR